MVIVPAIDIALEVAVFGEQRDRRGVFDPAPDQDAMLVEAVFDRHLLACGIAERGKMHEADMGGIAEIVGEVEIIGIDPQCVAMRGAPAGLIILLQIIDQRSIGPIRIARPDPHQPHLLVQRIGRHVCVGGDHLLAGDTNAASVGPKSHAVIAALNRIAFELAHRQWRQPMRADVIERNHAPGLGAVDDKIGPKQAMRGELSRHVARPGERIPGIARSDRCHDEPSRIKGCRRRESILQS